eukprot:1626880-Amphidinium_carterae.3
MFDCLGRGVLAELFDESLRRVPSNVFEHSRKSSKSRGACSAGWSTQGGERDIVVFCLKQTYCIVCAEHRPIGHEEVDDVDKEELVLEELLSPLAA